MGILFGSFNRFRILRLDWLPDDCQPIDALQSGQHTIGAQIDVLRLGAPVPHGHSKNPIEGWIDQDIRHPSLKKITVRARETWQALDNGMRQVFHKGWINVPRKIEAKE